MGSLIGGILGQNAASEDRDAAKGMSDAGIAAYSNIGVPTVEEQRIALQKLASQGELTPELEKEILEGPSAYNKIELAKTLREAQMSSLFSLKERGETGLTPQDRAAMNEIRLQAAQADRAKQESILQNMAARGMGGSGNEIAARFAASQAAASDASAAGDRLMGQAYTGRLQALTQSGQLASQINQQDYAQASDKARAEDLINQFNVQNRIGVQQRNVGVGNQAQAQNLSEKQRIADTNVNLSNQQEQYNKALIQQRFQNEMAKAGGLSGQLQAGANMRSNLGQQTAQGYYQIGAGTDQAIQGFMGSSGDKSKGGAGGTGILALAGMSDERCKENIKPAKDEIRNLLDKLSAYKFDYKDKQNGDDDTIGVMAQDLEKSEAGKNLVIDTPKGKMINSTKGVSATLAALADINKRLKALENK